MATPPVTKRFSQQDKLTGNLQPTDRVTLTQTNQDGKKTVNANIAEVGSYITNKALQVGLDELIVLGLGVAGDGTASDPLRIDDNFLKNTLIEKDRIQYTIVGNRRTRYLPISRRTNPWHVPMYYGDTGDGSTSLGILPVGTVERTGELKVIYPGMLEESVVSGRGSHAYQVSIGDWDIDGNLDSLQVIEREPIASTMPIPYITYGVMGNSLTSLLIVTKPLDGQGDDGVGSPRYYFANTKEGSLNEAAWTDLSPIPDWQTLTDNRHYATLRTSTGRYIFYTANGNDTGVIVNQVIGTGSSTSTVRINDWTTSYYGGTSSDNGISLAPVILGPSGGNYDLTDLSGGNIVVEPTLTKKPGSIKNIQIIQNPKSTNEAYLVIQRECVLRAQTTNQRINYSYDLVFRVTITANGVGSAVAISRYLSSRPTVNYVNGNFVFGNKRSVFRTAGLSVTETELRSILPDGSIMLVADATGTSSSTSTIRVLKSPIGKTSYDIRDIHAAVNANTMGTAQVLDPFPKHGYGSSSYPLYIASPIRIHMNGVDYTLPAQRLDLAPYVTGQPPVTITGIPYTKLKYNGLECRTVYLYVQKSGNMIVPVISVNKIPESINNTLIAAVYYPTDTSKSWILYGQAYSRLGYHRPAYEPQGASVPVSYGHPSSQPNEFWMKQR